MIGLSRAILVLALVSIVFTGSYAQKIDKRTEIVAEAAYRSPVFAASAETKDQEDQAQGFIGKAKKLVGAGCGRKRAGQANRGTMRLTSKLPMD